MRILDRSTRYKILSSFFLLSIPIFLLNLWVLARGQIQFVIENKLYKWSILQALYAGFVFWGFYKQKKWSFYLAVLVCFSLFSFNAWYLTQTKNYAIGFFALFILILSVSYLSQMWMELNAPFLRTGAKWFEGKPKIIPQVLAESTSGHVFDLSVMDDKGCFAFLKNGEKNLESIFKISELELRILEKKLSVNCKIMTTAQNENGFGFKFVLESDDSKKEMEEFMDFARSYGYVQ